MRYHQTLLCSADKWVTVEATPTTVLAICPQAKAFQSITNYTMICQKGYVESISHTVQVIKVIV